MQIKLWIILSGNNQQKLGQRQLALSQDGGRLGEQLLWPTDVEKRHVTLAANR